MPYSHRRLSSVPRCLHPLGTQRGATLCAGKYAAVVDTVPPRQGLEGGITIRLLLVKEGTLGQHHIPCGAERDFGTFLQNGEEPFDQREA